MMGSHVASLLCLCIKSWASFHLSGFRATLRALRTGKMLSTSPRSRTVGADITTVHLQALCLHLSGHGLCVWILLRRKYLCKKNDLSGSFCCWFCTLTRVFIRNSNVFGHSLHVFCQKKSPKGDFTRTGLCVFSFVCSDFKHGPLRDHPECNRIFYLSFSSSEYCCCAVLHCAPKAALSILLE